MASAGEPPVQVVDKDGIFNASAVAAFARDSGVVAVGGGYQMVAIMGPQSSGKSTLLNHLFGTGFREMNAEEGRSQTTQGIWVSRSHKLEHCTLVLDLEGSDGRERGEDDTAFERQAALFAMALADVLLVNIWCHDIGREAGAGKPLMKTILQVHLKLLQDAGKRTHLVFVIRDKSKKTPLSSLESVLKEDLQRMWGTIPKPPHAVDRPLEDFFRVMYVALSSYEEREEEFKAEVVMMRQRFDPDHEESFVKPESKLPGSSLAMSAERLWEVVHSHKDLNLPAHKVMVANIRCKEIMTERLAELQSDQAWEALANEAKQGTVPDFGATIAGLMSSCLSGYDEEAQYFDQNVCKERRVDLLRSLHDIGSPILAQQQQFALESMTKVLKDRLNAADGESETFAEASEAALAEADAFIASTAAALHVDVDGVGVLADEEEEGNNRLRQQAGALVEDERAAQVESIAKDVTKKTKAAMGGVALTLLEDMPGDLWPSLRDALVMERRSALQQLTSKLKGFSPRDGEIQGLVETLSQEMREDVEQKAREAAKRAVHLLKEKFSNNFNYDASGIPRVWGARDNIPKITSDARAAAALCLAQLAVIRLDSGVEEAAAGIESALLEHLVEGNTAKPTGGGSNQGNPLALSSWASVPEDTILLQPPECRRLWRQFRTETDFVVSNASNTQQAHQMASNRMPPLWAILAIAFFGFDEFIGVLYSPIYMMLGILGFLFARQLYVELDVDTEMQKGALPGLISLSSKAGPVFRHVSMHTAEAVAKLLGGEEGLPSRVVASLSPKKHGPAGQVEMSHMDGGRGRHAEGLRRRGGDGSSDAAAQAASVSANPKDE